MAKFTRGESVVCINDDFGKVARVYGTHIGLVFPVRGKCYVVRRYVIHDHHPCIVLVGIKNPRVLYMDDVMREAGFWEERFERAPSIEGLREIATVTSTMLGASQEMEDEDALEKVS